MLVLLRGSAQTKESEVEIIRNGITFHLVNIKKRVLQTQTPHTGQGQVKKNTFVTHPSLFLSLSLYFSQCGELLYEKRQYDKGHWACITMHEDTYEQSICYGFMRIMKYICQQNSLGKFTSNKQLIH